MALEDNVALVALVVSLIALAIAVGQLTQQLLGTAEGYRRCAKQVIDPWHRLRWRHFVFSEFRYEPHFITPQLYISAERETDEPINKRDAEIQAPRVLSATLKYGRDNAASQLATTAESPDPEKYIGLSHSRRQPMKARGSGSLLQSQNRASWIEFLRRLHEVYCSYDTATLAANRAPGHQAAPPTSYHALPWSNREKTQILVKFTEWIWDILPDGVSKPLATSTVSAITILALRMGMQWTSSNERWLMYGSGYSITFQEVPALGIVAKLNRSGGRPDEPPKLILSKATDKLMCGIIPGSEYLVEQDLHCVDDNRNGKTMTTICRAIAAEDARDAFASWQTEGKNWEPQNEAITLLCEFLPVANSTCTTHYFWGWKPRRKGVFAFWKGTYKLYRHLCQREAYQHLNDDTAQVLKKLKFLEKTYRNDLHGLNGRRARDAQDIEYGTGAEDRERKQMQLLADCRNIFDWTTDWFVRHDFHQQEDSDGEDDDNRTAYMRLVAAHVYMSIHAYSDANTARDRYQKRRRIAGFKTKEEIYHLYDKDGNGELIAHDGEPGMPVMYSRFRVLLYELATAYIKHLEHDKHGVVREMRDIIKDDRRAKIDEENVKNAWWVMMLRGMVWTLSTSHSSKGDPVPRIT